MKETVKLLGGLAGIGVGIFFGLYAQSEVDNPDWTFSLLVGLISGVSVIFAVDRLTDNVEWLLIKLRVVHPKPGLAITEKCPDCHGIGSVKVGTEPCTECQGEGERLTAFGLTLVPFVRRIAMSVVAEDAR